MKYTRTQAASLLSQFAVVMGKHYGDQSLADATSRMLTMPVDDMPPEVIAGLDLIRVEGCTAAVLEKALTPAMAWTDRERKDLRPKILAELRRVIEAAEPP